MRPRNLGLAAVFSAAASLSVTAAFAMELPANDYPTVSRADYVYGCMQANGPTREILEKCSCSIDQIAALLPFAEYEEAETIMSVQLRGGESVATMSYAPIQAKIKKLKLAQIEAELRCF
jgi:hypothetical protein